MSEFIGRTIDEAIETGLKTLGLSREEAEIEILDEGRGGVFGLGSKEARVIIRSLSVGSPAPAAPPSPSPDPETDPEPAVVAPPVVEQQGTGVESETTADDDDLDDEITGYDESELEALDAENQVLMISRNFLQGMLDHMGLDTTVEAEIQPADDGGEIGYYLNIAGQDLGILIGRRAETLDAIQYLVRLVANRHTHAWHRVEIDVERYKQRRETSLQRLAQNMADRAVREQCTIMLEAMPARERRLVHLALRDREDVYTESTGEGENRKVTILPA